MLLSLAQSSLFAGMAGMMILFWILAIVATVFWLWMIIDVLTSPMETGEKVLWFLVIFFLHLIGAIIYYVVKRRTSHPGGGRPAIT